jgi:hypothetical protein
MSALEGVDRLVREGGPVGGPKGPGGGPGGGRGPVASNAPEHHSDTTACTTSRPDTAGGI